MLRFVNSSTMTGQCFNSLTTYRNYSESTLKTLKRKDYCKFLRLRLLPVRQLLPILLFLPLQRIISV